jgi:hypothetical protein
MAKKVEREPTRREAKKVIAATQNHYKRQAAANAIDLKRPLGVKNNLCPKNSRGLTRNLEVGRRNRQNIKLRPRQSNAEANPTVSGLPLA